MNDDKGNTLERSLGAYGSILDDAIERRAEATSYGTSEALDNDSLFVAEAPPEVVTLGSRRRFINGPSVAALAFAAAAAVLMISATSLTSRQSDDRDSSTEVAAEPDTGSQTEAAAVADAAPTTPTQLGFDALDYQGAFILPETDAWTSNGHAMTYLPSGDPGSNADNPGSLVMAGRKADRLVGEVAIPTPVISSNTNDLPLAEILREPVDITGGRIECPFTCESVEVAGLAYLDDSDRIAWNIRDWYNAAAADLDSLGWTRSDFSDPAGTWHIGPRGEAFHNAKTSNYLFTAPKSFADQYLGGRRLIAGNHRPAGTNGGGQGPSLIAIAPSEESDLSDNAELGATKLLTHPFIQECMGDPTACTFPDYRAADLWEGGVWVETEDHSGLMIVGRKSIGYTCYGVPGKAYPDDERIIGVEDCRDKPIDPDVMCPGYKGWNGGPFEPMMLFYSSDDLAEVAQGLRAPESVLPVSTHIPREVVSGPCALLESAAYDVERGLIYVAESNAVRYGRTVVHVWKLDGSDNPTGPTSSTTTTEPTAPTTSSTSTTPTTSSTSSTTRPGNPPSGIELLEDPDLNHDLGETWWTNINVQAGDGEACMEVPDGAVRPWDAAFGQARFSLLAGHTYRVEVTVSADRQTTGRIEVQELGGGYRSYLSSAITIEQDDGTPDQADVFEFTAATDEPVAGITLNLGEHGPSTVCVDRISLVDLG